MIHCWRRLACIGGVKCIVLSNAGNQSKFLQLGGFFFHLLQMKFSKSVCWPPGVKFGSGPSEARTAVDFVYAKSQCPIFLSLTSLLNLHNIWPSMVLCLIYTWALWVWSTHLPSFSSHLTIWFFAILFPPVLYVTDSIWEGVKEKQD